MQRLILFLWCMLFCIIMPSMDHEQIRQRIRALRRRVNGQKLDGLIVTGMENIRYLSGFRGHDSWLLVLRRSVILITDSRYSEQAQGECLGCRIVERKGPLAHKVNDLLGAHRSVKVLGVDDHCTVAVLKTLRKALSVKVKPVGGVVEDLRQFKTDQEVRLIRRAARIAFDAMDWALSHLKAGITERELAALYVYRLSSSGATEGFETIVCFGPNGSRNHHQPGARKLRKNDTVLLDFGANYEGYTSDTTRCFAVGVPSDHFCRVYQAVARAQAAAIQAVGPGVQVCQVDAAARKIIQEAGFPVYGHGTGHGLGLNVHERPNLAPSDKKTTLEPGQVITIEPGVYLPGRFGVRLEDDVLVTATGRRILSRDKRFNIDPDAVPIR